MRTLLLQCQVVVETDRPGLARHFNQWIYDEDGVTHRVHTPLGASMGLEDLPSGPLDTRTFMPTHDSRWPQYKESEHVGQVVWIKTPSFAVSLPKGFIGVTGVTDTSSTR